LATTFFLLSVRSGPTNLAPFLCFSSCNKSVSVRPTGWQKGFSYSPNRHHFFPLPCFLPNPKPRQALPIKVLKVLVNKSIEEISVFHGPWLGLYSSRAESSIECSSLAYLISFRTRVELEFITERDILFKLDSFNFISNISQARSYHELLN
jgi:hypothetical protein